MGYWHEHNPKRIVVMCDQTNFTPFGEDEQEDDSCKTTVTISVSVMKAMKAPVTELGVHRYIRTLPEPWLVQTTGYSTGIGNTYLFTCPECLYDKEFPY